MTQDKKETFSERKKDSTVSSESKTKVVIRRLPPSLTKEAFLEQVSPLQEYDYFQFFPSEQSSEICPFSRAYINFINVEDIWIFQDKFDGYVFLDSKGNEYPAIVEYSPFAKIPKNVKPDARVNTIENDADYLKFIEMLNKSESQTYQTPEVILEEIEAKEKEAKAKNGSAKVITPLIDYLNKKREERIKSALLAREERRKRDLERAKHREEEKKRRIGNRNRDRERRKEDNSHADWYDDDDYYYYEDDEEIEIVKTKSSNIKSLMDDLDKPYKFESNYNKSDNKSLLLESKYQKLNNKSLSEDKEFNKLDRGSDKLDRNSKNVDFKSNKFDDKYEESKEKCDSSVQNRYEDRSESRYEDVYCNNRMNGKGDYRSSKNSKEFTSSSRRERDSNRRKDYSCTYDNKAYKDEREIENKMEIITRKNEKEKANESKVDINEKEKVSKIDLNEKEKTKETKVDLNEKDSKIEKKSNQKEIYTKSQNSKDSFDKSKDSLSRYNKSKDQKETAYIQKSYDVDDNSSNKYYSKDYREKMNFKRNEDVDKYSSNRKHESSKRYDLQEKSRSRRDAPGNILSRVKVDSDEDTLVIETLINNTGSDNNKKENKIRFENNEPIILLKRDTQIVDNKYRKDSSKDDKILKNDKENPSKNDEKNNINIKNISSKAIDKSDKDNAKPPEDVKSSEKKLKFDAKEFIPRSFIANSKPNNDSNSDTTEKEQNKQSNEIKPIVDKNDEVKLNNDNTRGIESTRQKIRYKDRPERAIYRPGQKKRESINDSNENNTKD